MQARMAREDILKGIEIIEKIIETNPRRSMSYLSVFLSATVIVAKAVE